MSSMSGQHGQEGGKDNYSLLGLWLRRLGETYLGAWLLDLFQASSQAMASAAASGPNPATGAGAGGGGGGGGPLSFMGCMREASPPPFDEQPRHHHHQHQYQQQHQRPIGLPTGGEFAQLGHGFDSMPKEPKKRRFHPLRGLRRIFRKKSRGAADGRLGGAASIGGVGGGGGGGGEVNGEHVGLRGDRREEVTLRDPAGRPDEIRSRSASELLTDSCDRDRLFLRRRGMEESFANLQRGGVAGQLSVSHDSVFPGEVPQTRPLSSLDMHASLERRTAKASNNDTDHKDSHTAQRHRISLRVLEQIKTVIENRNQIAAVGTAATTTTTTTTETANSLHNRFTGSRDKSHSSSSGSAEDTHAKVPRRDAPTPTNAPINEEPSSPLNEDLPELTTGSLNHTAALHRISVRPKNRRPPRRSTPQTINTATSTASNNSNNVNNNNNNNVSNSSSISINNNSSNSNSNSNNNNNNNNNSSSISSSNGLPRIDSISENSIDTLDSLEAIVLPASDSSIASSSHNRAESPSAIASTPQEPSKPIPILRKSSSRLSRNSEVFEELEAKLPVLRKPAVSPDSLESNLDTRSSGADPLLLDIGVATTPEEIGVKSVPPPIPRPSPRTASTGSEGYERSTTVSSSPRRRSSSNRLSKSPDSLESSSPGWFSKSSEGFDKLSDFEREATTASIATASNSNGVVTGNNSNGKPVAARRLLLNPISKSQERVCCMAKSSDSLEALEALNSDDSMERRRSSFEIRPRRNQVHKLMSKSTECFDSTLVEHQQLVVKAEEKRKRASVSEMNLSRPGVGRGHGGVNANKPLSKSSESFEKISSLGEATLHEKNGVDVDKMNNCWRGNRRLAHSSESSDNLELEDNCKLENRNKARRSTPKRLSSNSFADEQDNVAMLTRKPSARLQKSSESSELGSTDTLDSERRNTLKSSDSDETLDSLEKDLQEQQAQQLLVEQDRKDEETTESVVERREKGASEEEQDEKVGSYWRRRTNSHESKEVSNNLDIHQLLAYTLVSRIQENGNNDEHSNNDDNNEKNRQDELDPEEDSRTAKTICSTSPQVVYPKKKQHQHQHHLHQQQQQQQQSGSEDNKTLSSTINNLLSSKTDEDLQNMLNGNISEVSTDTKSFREKLIMFEKLGK